MAEAVHFILYVADQERSMAFYRAALAAEPRLHVEGMTEFALPGGAILGLMPEAGIRRLLGDAVADPSQAPGVPRAETYLVVNDAAASHARALAAGARELSPLQRRSWGHDAAYSQDPDGHVLVFASPREVRPRESDAAQPNASSILVLALLAYSIHEHQDPDGTATGVHLRLQPRSCSIEDNGRGMSLHRDGYVVGLLEQLAARRPQVALHGIGLAMVAMASPMLSIESRRNGQRFTQAFAWGVAQGPVRAEPWGGVTGTRTSFTLPPDAVEIDIGQVMAQVEVWRTAYPRLELDVAFQATRLP